MPPASLLREIRVRLVSDEIRLYRACLAPNHPRQADSFRSHYELRRPPRGAEFRATVIHMAVSMFETADPCWSLIDRTRGRIASHVAELRLPPEHGICSAKTGGPLHWSIWAQPGELLAAIANYVDRDGAPIS